MKRRDLLAGLGALGLAGTARTSLAFGTIDLASQARPLWDAWRNAFLMNDGRVVDTLQQSSSHTEGQGYGMLLATVFEDANAFASMFDWTERNLAIRNDALLAWRWLPNQANPVADPNNATDGDLFYAWSLVRAAAKFNNRGYLLRAQEIAQAIADLCITPQPGAPDRLVMLPAAFGFKHDGYVTLNPSYYMPTAMREVAAATGVTTLAIAAQHGEDLLAQLAETGLVPDWINLSANGAAPSDRLSPNAGYEAMRVPLFLIWSRAPQHMAVRRMAAIYERAVEPGVGVPTVIEPASGVVLEKSPDPGYQALAGLTICSAQGSAGATIPPFTARQPYYPATLQLFAMIAANETLPECIPI